jgi:hypothetical protein
MESDGLLVPVQVVRASAFRGIIVVKKIRFHVEPREQRIDSRADSLARRRKLKGSTVANASASRRRFLNRAQLERRYCLDNSARAVADASKRTLFALPVGMNALFEYGMGCFHNRLM